MTAISMTSLWLLVSGSIRTWTMKRMTGPPTWEAARSRQLYRTDPPTPKATRPRTAAADRKDQPDARPYSRGLGVGAGIRCTPTGYGRSARTEACVSAAPFRWAGHAGQTNTRSAMPCRLELLRRGRRHSSWRRSRTPSRTLHPPVVRGCGASRCGNHEHRPASRLSSRPLGP